MFDELIEFTRSENIGFVYIASRAWSLVLSDLPVMVSTRELKSMTEDSIVSGYEARDSSCTSFM